MTTTQVYNISIDYNTNNDTEKVHIHQMFHILHFIVFLLVILIGICANILVIVIISMTVKLHTTMSSFVLSLASSDLALCVVALPTVAVGHSPVAHLFKDSYWCIISGVCYIQFRVASVLALTTLGTDRCLAVKNSLKYAALLNPRKTKCVIAVIWILAGLLALLPFIYTDPYSFRKATGLCTPNLITHPGYTLVLLIGALCMPMVITFVVYCIIAHAAFKQAKKGTLVCDENHCTYVPSRKKEMKALKTPAIMTGKT